MLTDQLVKYVHETLNITLSLHQWGEGAQLPLFLRDNYTCYQAEVYGLEFLMMVDSSGGKNTPSMVSKHVEQVKRRWSGEVVYVIGQVSAYIRKRLIEAGIQFIVPGNQLYLPVLGMDLREYFRQRRQIIYKFSPATQALLFYWIYNRAGIGRDITTPTEMAHILGYTKMTMSRAFKEVDGALDEVSGNEKDGDAKKDRFMGQELWAMFQHYWRNPVSLRRYLPKSYLDRASARRSGLTALAAYSMLAEPAQEVYAVSQSEWKELKHKHGDLLLDHPDAEAVEIEVWRYPPDLFAQDGCQRAVDPLSLYLKGSHDERVEMALEELLGDVRW